MAETAISTLKKEGEQIDKPKIYNEALNILNLNKIKSSEDFDKNREKMNSRMLQFLSSKNPYDSVEDKMKQEGGAPQITKIILENNSTDLNISEFAEPVIYLKKSSNSNIDSFGTMSGNKIPVFGYLTVGKQLMLRLLEIQTNQRVSFKKPDTTIEYLKNYALQNPLFILTLATSLFATLSALKTISGR